MAKKSATKKKATKKKATKKKAAEKKNEEAKKTEEEIKNDTPSENTEAPEVKKTEKAPTEEEAKKVQEGFIKDISDKISACESLEDLEALNQEVYDIWAEEVPAEIQALAGKKGQEIEDGILPKKDVSEQVSPTPKNWSKCTHEEAQKLDKEGKLAGYDRKKGIALINK